VREVQKRAGVRHLIDGEVPPHVGFLRGILDWAPRLAHMRMHTAQHVLSGVVFDGYKARTVGNQIHADHSRIDFAPAAFSEHDLKTVEDKVNGLLSGNLPVTVREEDRSMLEKRIDARRANLDLLPRSVRRLRIVEIGDIDMCPCGGTHVRNTSETGRLNIFRRESKGKDTERITYTLDK